ncbi:class I adenylate-forming enzyme family protein [Amycolatopsis sp. EV170708-02-1]|uniref:class I adenylate-forming enzyme family protein n=1 Tax=Amycolatopsis sp. EV170708-02-1 TaxID=2919322 RepID=UPI001F0C0010|nr:class I adenylate-forming enzyme family protein [Amycolatopsis sp. EV170708-02-1]UMP03725.1 acyl--CoA ligase [Amycolatopsis sp. EV170708-02-1]
MYLLGTHRSVADRLKLSTRRELGAGNFFWHVCEIARDPDRPLLFRIEDGAVTGRSLAELRDDVLRRAHWYAQEGVKPGTRVGVHLRDGLAGFLHHIAITTLGGVTTLTNPRLPPDVAAHYFDRTETALVITDIEVPAGSGRRYVDEKTVDVPWDGPSPPLPDTHRHTDDDLVLISHSSGTTGVPKPTAFAHRTFSVGKRERLWKFPSLRTDRMLTALPHSHSSGISYLSLALMLGMPTMLADGTSGAAVAEAMNAFRPTLVLGFPGTLAELPISSLTTEAADAVHTWMGMGDASHERHIRPLVTLGRGGSTYVDGLGSSEMGMVLFKHAYTAGSTTYARAIGKPVRVVREAAALDDEGRVLPPGEAGLLGVRTPSVTPGYVNDETLNHLARSGGFFLTGDVVRQDESGIWYHLDRTPDVIETAGGPVYSLPLEEVVLNETKALDAAVIAVADPAAPGRSVPAAVVLFGHGEVPDAEEIRASCNLALARAGLTTLAAVVVACSRSELPVGVTGKVLKRELRERHRELLTGAANGAEPKGWHG